ncbi:PhoD-like phosphatase-domain-containing protein [Lipomyces arxii]|uniref:PhoD-like phosphatase-domain-containing protein n=1 Tax=Lipomyces arxii TaxID=56418 RepID=UPI0034CF19CA
MGLKTFAVISCEISSTLLRLLSYIFLRWIPSSVIPNILYTVTAIYVSSFVYIFSSEASEAGLGQDQPGTATDKQDEQEKSKKKRGKQKKTEKKVPRWHRSPLTVLLVGVPAHNRPGLTMLTAAVNLSLVFFVVDLIYTAFTVMPILNLAFTRIGYVSETEAHFVIREALKFPFGIRYKEIQEHDVDPFNVTSWAGWTGIKLGDYASPETDYTTPVVLRNLTPDTVYAYNTPTANGTFKTAPVGPGKFSFLSSSCIKARVPYSPLDHPLKIHGFRAHKALMSQADFFLFLGDFMYADAPKLMGTDVESYRRHYRLVYADMRLTGFNKLPMVHVFDDHEIINDYDADDVALYEPAITAWKEYQAGANPIPVRENTTYYTFERQGIPFFLLDTRTYRSAERLEDNANKTMLGKDQIQDLRAWLDLYRDAPFKIIVSSVPFTKNWQGIDMADTWAGYLHERALILKYFWDVGGVVILSGDRHEAAAIEFPSPDGIRRHDAIEFSTSPFSQFYVPIRTHKQRDSEDVTIMYMPDGNSKVGKIDIDTAGPDGSSSLVFTLYIDGTKRWQHRLEAS